VPDSKASKRDARQERLAAQLRANLKKRKTQSRARVKPAESAGTDAPDPTDLRPPDPSAKS
jgi:hypothetical protein